MEPRRTLVAGVGSDLSFKSLVCAVVGSDRFSEAVVSFCDTTVSQKERDLRHVKGRYLPLSLSPSETGVQGAEVESLTVEVA